MAAAIFKLNGEPVEALDEHGDAIAQEDFAKLAPLERVSARERGIRSYAIAKGRSEGKAEALAQLAPVLTAAGESQRIDHHQHVDALRAEFVQQARTAHAHGSWKGIAVGFVFGAVLAACGTWFAQSRAQMDLVAATRAQQQDHWQPPAPLEQPYVHAPREPADAP